MGNTQDSHAQCRMLVDAARPRFPPFAMSSQQSAVSSSPSAAVAAAAAAAQQASTPSGTPSTSLQAQPGGAGSGGPPPGFPQLSLPGFPPGFPAGFPTNLFTNLPPNFLNNFAAAQAGAAAAGAAAAAGSPTSGLKKKQKGVTGAPLPAPILPGMNPSHFAAFMAGPYGNPASMAAAAAANNGGAAPGFEPQMMSGMPRGRWTEEMTKRLIDLRTKMDSKFRSVARPDRLWAEITTAIQTEFSAQLPRQSTKDKVTNHANHAPSSQRHVHLLSSLLTHRCCRSLCCAVCSGRIFARLTV